MSIRVGRSSPSAVKALVLAVIALGGLWAVAFASVAQALPPPGAPARSPALTKRLAAALEGLGPSHVPRTSSFDAAGRPLYTNRLLLETSPYLRQHAHNPVEWYP